MQSPRPSPAARRHALKDRAIEKLQSTASRKVIALFEDVRRGRATVDDFLLAANRLAGHDAFAVLMALAADDDDFGRIEPAGAADRPSGTPVRRATS